MQRVRARLTFANVVALLALFISLGGGVYAASKLNGKQIKKGSVAGNRLKPDTVTGTQINESSLGIVPSSQSAEHAQNANTAQIADAATTAGNAATFAGNGPDAFVSSSNVRRVLFDTTTRPTSPEPTGAVLPLLELGPLTLTGACSWSASKFSIQATSTAQEAELAIGYMRNASSSSTTSLSLGSTSSVIFSDGVGNQNTTWVGTIVYNDPSTTISMPFTANLDDSAARSDCTLTGTATRTSN